MNLGGTIQRVATAAIALVELPLFSGILAMILPPPFPLPLNFPLPCGFGTETGGGGCATARECSSSEISEAIRVERKVRGPCALIFGARAPGNGLDRLSLEQLIQH